LYVLTSTKDSGVSALVFTVVDGSSRADAVMLVRDQSEVEALDQLRGRRVCYSDIRSTTGYLLPRAAIRKAGLDPNVDLIGHFSGTHQQALRDLRDGVCDVTGTFTANYLSADEAGTPAGALRVLAVTGRTPHDTVARGPSATDEETAALTEALLAFDPMADIGKARLGSVWRVTGFEPASEERYQGLRTAIELEAP